VPRKAQFTQVGRRKLEISNLDKVLYPETGIIKAEVIAYYLNIAPTILRHIKGRPLTLVRYPNGVTEQSFFQKNKPEKTPPWIEDVKLGDGEKKINYVIATEDATLVWTANLAALELHQMHSRSPHYENPDYVVWDLDPPEGGDFRDVVQLALDFREHLDAYGYHGFVKTTGRKGLHVVAPLEPKFTFNAVFEAAKAVAQPFVEKNGDRTTLHIKKDARKGRTLIDVFRNRQFQTILSTYSARGTEGGPVSTPVTWEELEHLDDPKVHNVRTVVDRVVEDGDPWEAIAAYAVPIHTAKKATASKKQLPKNKHYKTPEALDAYAKKRDFDTTPEPPVAAAAGKGNGFVVHRHHASRLHYDLRLEKDGTLQSWAVPRGLPPRPGIKRMAVKVEDHPLEYLDWEGTIPKGEYGAGPMWVFARGTYEVTKDKKDKSFYFRLQSKELTAEYRLINTKDKEWLLERVDTPQVDLLQRTWDPMLAESAKAPPPGDDHIYEIKWDGIRALISLDEGELRIRSRSQRDLTYAFPELRIPEESFRANGALFDGEIVCLDEDGRPIFTDAMHRIQQKTENAVKRAQKRHPAVCYLFDCLYLDGRQITNDPVERRRAWLEDLIRPGSAYRMSEALEDGPALFEAARQAGLEGIVAKERRSSYYPGRRSSVWLKIKVRDTTECTIVGYTEGKGDRKTTFGALHLAQPNGKGLHYVGKVGTGFDDKLLKSIRKQLETLDPVDRPVDTKPVDDAQTTWLEPRLVCEIQYASWTKNETLREPVFVRLRPDLNLQEA
jgi:bifunctional non-homologous end joining protein LigD